jgi:hypothetical protein
VIVPLPSATLHVRALPDLGSSGVALTVAGPGRHEEELLRQLQVAQQAAAVRASDVAVRDQRITALEAESRETARVLQSDQSVVRTLQGMRTWVRAFAVPGSRPPQTSWWRARRDWWRHSKRWRRNAHWRRQPRLMRLRTRLVSCATVRPWAGVSPWCAI